MANKKVQLYRKCKTPDGWKRYPVVLSANGKVKPNAVTVGGVEVVYPVGHYELGSYSGSKRVWTRVKGNASDALASLKTAQKTANVVALAGEAGVQVVVDPKRVAIREAGPKFVQAALDRRATEAAEIYQRTLNDFFGSCTKTYADELTHDDVLVFHGEMRKRGLADRTVFNRHMNLRAFLISLGFREEELRKIAGDKPPRFEKTLPEIYEPGELSAFFKSLELGYDKLLFGLLLRTGLREREAMHLEWRDLSIPHRTLRVESKPMYSHKIKDSEEREVPLTKDLIKELEHFRKQHPRAQLVFGRRGGEEDAPDGHLLRRLKTLVRDAGFNCGSCGACITNKECSRWYLHKFRANYITTLLRNGMDLRTVMVLSGHADIESVMCYLRPAGTKEMQAKVDTIKWH